MEGSGQVPLWSYFAVAILLCLSAFFSSSETALLRLRIPALESRAEQGDKVAKAAVWLLKRPQEMLSTILIGNNLVNVALPVLVTLILVELLGQELGSVAATVGTTVLLVLFGEIIPKTVAAVHPNRASRILAIPIRLLAVVLWPANKLTEWMTSPFTSGLGEEEDVSQVSPDEIKTLVRKSAAEGYLKGRVPSLVTRALSVHRDSLHEVMTPRTEMVTLKGDLSVREAVDKHLETGFSRIPVTGANADEIIGVSFLKDLLPRVLDDGDGDLRVSETCRKAIFLPEMLAVPDALTKMQQEHQHLALVVDEFGGVEGLVSVEDLLEQLVGEIVDEHDREEAGSDIIKEISDSQFVVRGKMNLAEFTRLTDIAFEDRRYSSLGGLIMDRLGRPAKAGDTVTIDGANLQVVKVTGQTIKRVLIEC